MQLEQINACNSQAFFFGRDPPGPRARRRVAEVPSHAQAPVQEAQAVRPGREAWGCRGRNPILQRVSLTELGQNVLRLREVQPNSAPSGFRHPNG